jgi:MFS family permease
MLMDGPLRTILLHRLGPVGTIALAQLLGTSLWFSVNGSADDLMRAWQLGPPEIGWLTNAVQLGFILGTLAISTTGYADRFQASTIFVLSAVVGALCNGAFAWLAEGMTSGLIYRFLVGVCLAGIYPMGMKLIVRWAPDRAGWALAQLVAMLTMGTALPHALKLIGANLPWQAVMTASSLFALVAAGLIAMLGEPANQSIPSQPAATRAGLHGWRAFRIPRFRAAAFGYFGHMWELYAFWTVVPLYIASTGLVTHLGGSSTGTTLVSVSGLAFLIMASGALGSLIGGALSRQVGSARVAAGMLLLSGTCCLVFVLGWRSLPPTVLLGVLLIWGTTVVADSPHFSALSARACPPEHMGSALALQNSIGFAITIIAIAVTVMLFESFGPDSAWILLPGPVLGLWAFRPMLVDHQ